MALPLKDNRGQFFYSVVMSNEEPPIKSTRVCVIYKLWREKIADPLCKSRSKKKEEKNPKGFSQEKRRAFYLSKLGSEYLL